MRIPSGEKGSANYYAEMIQDGEMDFVVMQICRKPQLCLTVMGIIEKYMDKDKALYFAMKIIKTIEEE